MIDYTKSQNIVLTLNNGMKVLFTGPAQLLGDEGIVEIVISKPYEPEGGIYWLEDIIKKILEASE